MRELHMPWWRGCAALAWGAAIGCIGIGPMPAHMRPYKLNATGHRESLYNNRRREAPKLWPRHSDFTPKPDIRQSSPRDQNDPSAAPGGRMQCTHGMLQLWLLFLRAWPPVRQGYNNRDRGPNQIDLG